MAPAVFKQFYEIFSSLMILLLTVAVYHRLRRNTGDSPAQTQQKYAIITSLIALNLVILAMKLAHISYEVAIEKVELAVTIARIGFIYLVLTFIFRVFDRSFDIAYERVPTVIPDAVLSERDLTLADTIKKALADEKLYRQMELSRESMAKQFAVSENHLSRVINRFFFQNFNTLINGYRVEEAKERLMNENTPITNIAFDVGFNSIPSFNRVFKQMTGISPTEYRNQRNKAA